MCIVRKVTSMYDLYEYSEHKEARNQYFEECNSELTNGWLFKIGFKDCVFYWGYIVDLQSRGVR